MSFSLTLHQRICRWKSAKVGINLGQSGSLAIADKADWVLSYVA